MGGKNKKGGKSYKKMVKSSNPSKARELTYTDGDYQDVVRITKNLGDCRFECDPFRDQGTTIIGHIRGSLRKRVWMKAGDFVIVSFRDFDPNTCDIIHKYTDDEAIQLKSEGFIPSNVNVQATTFELTEKLNEDEDFDFSFEDI